MIEYLQQAESANKRMPDVDVKAKQKLLNMEREDEAYHEAEEDDD